MNSILASCVVLLVAIMAVSSEEENLISAPFYEKGGCLDDMIAGDVFLKFHCEGECECKKPGKNGRALCTKCLTFELSDEDKDSCYHVDGAGEYPDCCRPRKVCRGDDDFDESKMSN